MLFSAANPTVQTVEFHSQAACVYAKGDVDSILQPLVANKTIWAFTTQCEAEDGK